jgi:hypothetical protein
VLRRDVSDAKKGDRNRDAKAFEQKCNTDASVFIIASARTTSRKPGVEKKSRAKQREDAVMSDGPPGLACHEPVAIAFFFNTRRPTRNWRAKSGRS